jgi:hypothetical protein
MQHHQMENRIFARGDGSRLPRVQQFGAHSRLPERTTRSLVVFLVRHVAASSSKTREVNTGATAGEGKNAPITGSTRWASPSARSAQIRGTVSVHQESLIC